MADNGSIIILDLFEGSIAKLSEFFVANGFAVTTAENGEEVLESARSLSYDAVILDLAADAEPDALLVSRIKRADPTIEIIVVTDEANGADAMTALSRGATTYLQRPLRLPALLHRVRVAVAIRRFHTGTRKLLADAGQKDTALARRTVTLERLLRFDHELMAIMDYRRAIDAMLNGLLDMTGGDIGAVLLVREEQGVSLTVQSAQEVCAASKDDILDALMPQWNTWGDPIPDIENVVVSGIEKGCESAKIRTSAVHPLVVQDRMIGVLGALSTSRDSLSPEADLLVQMVAERTEVVLENAFHHEHTRVLATTDPLTGLSNRRVLRERINREFERAHRSIVAGKEVPLSVIMSDIDSFKNFNDTYGHQLGDEVLKMAANCVMAEIRRATDIVARYGGEEFIFVAPDTSADSAAMLAERIRQRLARTPVVSEHGEHYVTASYGVATYPNGGAKTAEELVQQADEAMYAAKAAGKNRVAVSPSISDSEESRAATETTSS